MVPTDLRYTKDHEWVRVEGDRPTIGITAYAAEQLGDIVFVELPDVGRDARPVRDLRRRRIGQGRERPVRARRWRGDRDQRRSGGPPRARQQRPVRRRLDGPAPGGRREAARRAAGSPAPTTRSSLPAELPCRTDPTRAEDRARMLAALGIDHVDELFADIPAGLRASRLDLPEPEPELELSARLERLAARNRVDLASFLGAGVYRHFTPAAVDQILLRGEWYTAYTPYQPEVSQGTLQTIYEYESLIAELMGLDVVSASHYDGAAATAEAGLMACRATRRERVLVSRAASTPTTGRRSATYCEGGQLQLDEIPLIDEGPRGRDDGSGRPRARSSPTAPATVAGVLVAQPNFLGLLEPMADAGRLAHAAGAKFVAVVEPVSLAVLAPPRAYGADIAAGEGQPLGIPPAVRRPVSRPPRLHRRPRPPDPGPPRRHDHRCRRQARLRHDDARPRAGHPPREGRQQHLHQPGAPRAGRQRVRRHDRAAWVARCRLAGGRAGRGAGAGPRRCGRPAAARRCLPQRVRGPRPGRRRRPSPAARAGRAGWPRRSRPSSPTILPSRDALLVCATEVTTSADIRRFANALRGELGGPGGAGDAAARAPVAPPSPPERFDERHRPAAPAQPLRTLAPRPGRRQDPAPAEGRAGSHPFRSARGRPGRPCRN